jgi:iron(III) transport system substrate-binding protein
MKRAILLTSLVLALALVNLLSWNHGLMETAWAAPAQKPLAEESYEELVEGAKKEGRMVIWSMLSAGDELKTLDEFKKKYPFIKVEHTVLRVEDCREKLLMEAQSGKKSDVDVFENSNVAIVPLKKKGGILLSFPWAKVFKIDPRAIDPDNMALATYDAGGVLAYNTKLLSPDQLPRSYEDLLKPEWKGGKLGLDIRGFLFDELAASGAWTKEKVIDFGKKLLQQQPRFGRGQNQMAELLTAGEFPLGVIALKNVIDGKRRGAPIDWVPLEPVPSKLVGHSAYKEAQHPHCAILFIGWSATSEGQKVQETYAGRGLPFPGLDTTISRMLEGRKLAVVGWPEAQSKLMLEMENEMMKLWGAR